MSGNGCPKWRMWESWIESCWRWSLWSELPFTLVKVKGVGRERGLAANTATREDPVEQMTQTRDEERKKQKEAEKKEAEV